MDTKALAHAILAVPYDPLAPSLWKVTLVVDAYPNTVRATLIAKIQDAFDSVSVCEGIIEMTVEKVQDTY